MADTEEERSSPPQGGGSVAMGPSSLAFVRTFLDKLATNQQSILKFIACNEIFLMPATVFMLFSCARCHSSSPRYLDWPIEKLGKALFKKGLPIEAGSDRAALFVSYCKSISAKPVFPPQKSKQRSKLVSSSSAPATLQASLASDSANTVPQFSISSDPSSDLRYQIFNDIKQLNHPLSTTISTVSDCLDVLDSRITRL
ncbi:UNVERIFIED_CONTAM: hypothetical protein FKN15_050841 [Acipenser sinensis]